MDYQKLFLQRWKELENEIELEKEDGEQVFWKKTSFSNSSLHLNY